MTGTTTGRLPAAASHADASERALSKARDRCSFREPPVYADWLDAVTHGLLAVAAAIENSGADTADAITDLGERLGDVDDTLSAAASGMTGAAGRWRRMWRRPPLQRAATDAGA